MKRQAGFTLIEVMISVVILATLSIMTAMSIRSAVTGKKKLQTKIDIQERIRSAEQVIEKDINLAFHYNDINYDIMKQIQKEQTANPNGAPPPLDAEGNPLPTPPPLSGAVPKKNVLNEYLAKYKEAADKTQFWGEEDKLNFSSLSNIRRYKDSPENDQCEVGYYLAECRNRLVANKRSQCLWRRSSSFIDDKIDEGGNAVVILENVKSIHFSYYDPEKKEWIKTWFSDGERVSEDTRNKFPPLVQLALELDIDGKEYKDTIIAEIRLPNNADSTTGTNPDGTKQTNPQGGENGTP